MKHFRFLAIAALLYTAPLKAEFLQIDMSIYGMD